MAQTRKLAFFITHTQSDAEHAVLYMPHIAACLLQCWLGTYHQEASPMLSMPIPHPNPPLRLLRPEAKAWVNHEVPHSVCVLLHTCIDHQKAMLHQCPDVAAKQDMYKTVLVTPEGSPFGSRPPLPAALRSSREPTSRTLPEHHAASQEVVFINCLSVGKL